MFGKKSEKKTTSKPAPKKPASKPKPKASGTRLSYEVETDAKGNITKIAAKKKK